MPAYPYILVVGTTFSLPLPWYRPFRRLADMVGRELARSGFGLITGNTPGVDCVAARAFWAECLRRGGFHGIDERRNGGSADPGKCNRCIPAPVIVPCLSEFPEQGHNSRLPDIP